MSGKDEGNKPREKSRHDLRVLHTYLGVLHVSVALLRYREVTFYEEKHKSNNPGESNQGKRRENLKKISRKNIHFCNINS